MMVTLHAATIEWDDDSVEPHLLIATTLDDVRAQVRTTIEEWYDDFDDDTEIHDFVRGEGLEIEDWEIWHSLLHEMDGTPWVTFFERDVVIPIAVRRG
jgi:hypothetical protein